MTKSKNLGLNLPSRDNTTDLADINAISENFETIDNEFENVYNKLNNSGVVNTVSGNPIVLKDSASAPLQNLKLFGKTTQNGTPTPSAPVPLVSVGDSGSYEVGVYGKNLLAPCITSTSYGITSTYNANGSFTITGTNTGEYDSIVPFTDGKIKLPKGKYKMVGKFWVATYLNGVKQGTLYSNGITPTTFEIPNNEWELSPYYWCGENVSIDTTTYPMLLLESETDTTFVKGETPQTLTMPYTLRGVGDIKDEVDFAKGIKTQRFVSVDLGTVDYIYDSTELRFGGRVTLSGIPQVRKTKGLCEIYKVLSNGETYNRDWNNVLYFNGIGFQIHDKRYTDASALKTALSGVKLVYELETPIEIPLTETELNAYRQLHTNKPNTTILSEADMEVSYVADTKLYIDNKIAELTALTLEG